MYKVIIILTLSFNCLNSYSQSNFTDTSAKTEVINFIKWYTQNIDSIYYKYKFVKLEKNKNYRIDFNQVNAFLINLKKCNMLSDNYIKEFKNYFTRCDANFVNHPQFDDPPFGLDYDLVIKYNDYDNVITNLNKSKIIIYHKNKNFIFIVLEFTKWDKNSFELIKQKNKWLINKINGDFPMEINHQLPSYPKG